MVMVNCAFLTLVLCMGICTAQPSATEFNLLCRILVEANDMMLEPDYVYDETKDREIVKEVEVLYNTTTEDMDDFGNSLWETKDLLEKHPPPMQSQNRKLAHRELKKFITEMERKILENRQTTVEVNKKIEEARLPVAQGLYGDKVKEFPKEEGSMTDVRNNTQSIFNDPIAASQSCGNENETGKTLINDLFCVCVGEGDDADGPCHPKIWPPKSWHSNGGQGGWKQIKYGLGTLKVVPSFLESIEKIEKVCKKLIKEKRHTRNMPALLKEYMGMIGLGTNESIKKIFGHSGRQDKSKVTKCTGGSGSDESGSDKEKKNENICVDYTKTIENCKEIPWHKKFKEASDKLNEAKTLEDRILQNCAEIVLLKGKAWAAYSREKDDQTSNLDDVNVS
ncbi:Variant surface glycoprotein, partial [Trypanosoma congolense IL3000]